MDRIRDGIGNLEQRLHATSCRLATTVTIAGLVVLLLSSGKLPTISSANGITTVRIAPSPQDVAPGNTATTDLVIEDVTDLYGYEFQIAFEPALVEVMDAFPSLPGVQIQPGDFLSPDWIIQNSVDNGNGTIAFALSQQDPSPPQGGTGTLATITWRGKSAGTSPITMTYALLSAPRGEAIPATTQDGEILISVSLLGDVDEDGDVDLVDVMAVASRWRTTCENPDPDHDGSTPNYNATYDLNQDCQIDIVDIMLVVARWGETD